METIYLSGSDDVLRASRIMSDAASEMKRAASEMDYALQQHRGWMEQWLAEFRDAIAELRPKKKDSL